MAINYLFQEMVINKQDALIVVLVFLLIQFYNKLLCRLKKVLVKLFVIINKVVLFLEKVIVNN
jgi:hypothetical protein